MGFNLGKTHSLCGLHYWLLGCSLLVVSSVSFAGYEEGIAAYKQGDYDTAFQELTPLAEQGDVSVQRSLGFMYYVVYQNYTEAAYWYGKAAEQGDVSAQFELGLIYYKGEKVPQDYTEAAYWYRKVAEQRNPEVREPTIGSVYTIHGPGEPHGLAKYYLGRMYYKGEGVPQDYIEGHKWLNLAAAQGNEDARKLRGVLEQNMTFAQILEAQRLASDWPFPKRSSFPWERPTSPARPTSGSGKNLISDIQKYLNSLGYDAGPVDGLLKSCTRAAIRKFQRSLDIDPTGQPSQELLVLLKKTLDEKPLPTK